MMKETRSGLQVLVAPNEQTEVPQGETCMFRDGMHAYFVANINGVLVKSMYFLYEENSSTPDEGSAASYIKRTKDTGWYQESFSKGEWTCAYCGAIAHSLRVVNFPCPCRHGKYSD